MESWAVDFLGERIRFFPAAVGFSIFGGDVDFCVVVLVVVVHDDDLFAVEAAVVQLTAAAQHRGVLGERRVDIFIQDFQQGRNFFTGVGKRQFGTGDFVFCQFAQGVGWVGGEEFLEFRDGLCVLSVHFEGAAIVIAKSCVFIRFIAAQGLAIEADGAGVIAQFEVELCDTGQQAGVFAFFVSFLEQDGRVVVVLFGDFIISDDHAHFVGRFPDGLGQKSLFLKG